MSPSPSPSPPSSSSPSSPSPMAMAPIPSSSSSLVSIAATSSDLLTPLALPAPNAPLPLLPGPTATPNPRRIPPPCWTNDETLALIQSYRDKWLSLNRGNLRAAHWDEVALSVSLRSRSTPGATPKTPVQCRHKVEKLRKRYRSERNRSLSLDPSAPPFSPWIFFSHIHSMESPPPPPPQPQQPHYDSSSDDEPPDTFLPRRPLPNGTPAPLKFKIPKAVRSRNAGPRPPAPPGDSSSSSSSMGEMVRALKALGEGYVRTEQMKMEAAKEMERARMEAELRRTKMVLDAQWRIVDAVVGEIAMGKRKRKKAKIAAAAAAES